MWYNLENINKNAVHVRMCDVRVQIRKIIVTIISNNPLTSEIDELQHSDVLYITITL